MVSHEGSHDWVMCRAEQGWGLVLHLQNPTVLATSDERIAGHSLSEGFTSQSQGGGPRLSSSSSNRGGTCGPWR